MTYRALAVLRKAASKGPLVTVTIPHGCTYSQAARLLAKSRVRVVKLKACPLNAFKLKLR